MKWVGQIVVWILRAVFVWFQSQSTGAGAVDGRADPQVKTRLRDRIRDAWWLPVVALLVLLAGCAATRAVYVPAGEPVRLRQTVRNVKVWLPDEQGVGVPGVVDLKEGWYCLDYGEQEE